MNYRTALMACVAAGALAACASYTGVNTVRTTMTEGNSYNAYLATEYRELALFEADQMADWRDAEYYAGKALAAHAGEDVAPTGLGERTIPNFAADELAEGYKSLKAAQKKYMKNSKNHALLAEAQAKFDCWMEQQEENIQPEHIAECKVDFYKAMEALTGKKMIVVEAMYRVFFDFNGSTLDAEDDAVVAEIVKAAKDKPEMTIHLTGNTDTVGGASYNRALSAKRAMAVQEALIAAGIDAKRVKMLAKGEANLLVRTADGVQEAKNRRVDVLFSR